MCLCQRQHPSGLLTKPSVNFISYGTAKSGVGISAMSVLRPDLMMKCVVPVIMAGIIAVSQPALFHRNPQDRVRSESQIDFSYFLLN